MTNRVVSVPLRYGGDGATLLDSICSTLCPRLAGAMTEAEIEEFLQTRAKAKTSDDIALLFPNGDYLSFVSAIRHFTMAQLEFAVRNGPLDNFKQYALEEVSVRAILEMEKASGTSLALQSKIANLVSSLDTLSRTQDAEAEAIRNRTDNLNCWMLTLTIAGVLASAIAVYLACQGLSLQRQSLEIDRKALALQEWELAESGSPALSASAARGGKNHQENPADQSGSAEAANASGSTTLAAPEARSLPKAPGSESPPKPTGTQSPPDTKPAPAPVPPAN